MVYTHLSALSQLLAIISPITNKTTNMKISTLIIFFIFFCNLNAQEDNVWELLNRPKVQINKDLVAYTISESSVKNGVQSKMKMNNPSFKNPYNIYIRSNESSGKLVINNKNTVEDISLDFKYIYNIPDNDNSKVYEFLMLDDRFTLRYYQMKDGSNDILYLSHHADKRNSIELYYTIAKN